MNCMSHVSVKEVGKQLAKAGRLELKPLCVYGSDTIPSGVMKVPDVVKTGHRCIAKALLLVAAGEADGVYYGADVIKGICQGSLGWIGLAEFPEEVCDMLSTAGDEAMYLKESPACAAWTLKSMGKVTFPHKYLIIQACEKAGDATPLSYLCFGNAEQVRNLCGLVHFGADSPFGQIEAPWGSFCAVFISYPAGMAKGAPKDKVFIGPNAPDGNPLIPADMMAIAIPEKIARRMADDVERSFVVKCPETTYPAEYDREVLKALGRIK
jgi:hypothetical protein